MQPAAGPGSTSSGDGAPAAAALPSRETGGAPGAGTQQRQRRRERETGPRPELTAVAEPQEERQAKLRQGVRQVDLSALEYRLPEADEPSQKVTTYLPVSLVEELDRARALWGAENYAAFGSVPNTSAWREALLRVGLKHLNDEEFITLLRPDPRTGRRVR